MLLPVFWQTIFRLLKNGFNPVFGFTGLFIEIKISWEIQAHLNLVRYGFWQPF